MTPPKWFWPVIAACVVLLTVAVALHLRYTPAGRFLVLDTWRGDLCNVQSGCDPIRTP